jgi:hypothetical protein
MLQKKYFVAAVAVLSFSLASAQIASVSYDSTGAAKTAAPEEEKKTPVLSITGSVDGYYKYDFAKTAANSLTSFTQTHNTFALGMASVKFEHKGDKVSAVADLGFGPRAKDFAYTDDGITQAIKQLYVSYAPADWIKFTLGSWATHVGYELLDPQLNRNYSMSYMFTNGPFSHTGFKTELTKGKHGFMIGVANATDFRVPPSDMMNKKFILGQYSLAVSDNFKVYLNYVGGQNPDTSKVNQFDAVVTAKVSDKFNIGFNGTINSTRLWDGAKHMESQSWWGSALYLNFDPKPWFGLTLRGEYFGDKDHLKIAVAPDGCNIFATTLSANFKTGGFTFIPEFRLDNSNKEVFINKDGQPNKAAANFLVAAIYAF